MGATMLDNTGRKLVGTVAALALSCAACSVQAESLQEVIANRQLAQDWLDGKVVPDNPPKVTYTGLPFTMRVTSHQPANSGPILSILTPSLRLLEKMSNRAGAHVTRVDAGHLTPITHPADVTKVIVSAVDATS